MPTSATTNGQPTSVGSVAPDAEDDAPLGTCLAAVESAPVRWLWQDRLPLGMLSILDGDPDTGKTLLALTIAACVTRGACFPDGARAEHGAVILISLEDDLGMTLRPRLEAAGADLSRVFSLAQVPCRDATGQRQGQARAFVLPTDLSRLRQAIAGYGAKLVVIDPVMAALKDKVNGYRDQDVRTQVLTPLKGIAEETGCAILLVRHLTKSKHDNPLYAGGGSIGWVGAARSSLLAAHDPHDPGQAVLAPVKSNLAPLPPAWGYRLVTAPNGVGQVVWTGRSEHTAETLVRAGRGRPDAPLAAARPHAPVGSQEWERRHLSPTTRAVLAYVRARPHQVLRAAEVARGTGLQVETARTYLCRLAHQGRLGRVARGQFSALPLPPAISPEQEEEEGKVEEVWPAAADSEDAEAPARAA